MWLVEDRRHRGSQRSRLPGRHDQPVHAVGDDLGRAQAVAGDDRHPRGQRLSRDQRVALPGDRRDEQDVGILEDPCRVGRVVGGGEHDASPVSPPAPGTGTSDAVQRHLPPPVPPVPPTPPTPPQVPCRFQHDIATLQRMVAADVDETYVARRIGVAVAPRLSGGGNRPPVDVVLVHLDGCRVDTVGDDERPQRRRRDEDLVDGCELRHQLRCSGDPLLHAPGARTRAVAEHEGTRSEVGVHQEESRTPPPHVVHRHDDGNVARCCDADNTRP